jgi:DNA end-binding protein Ku
MHARENVALIRGTDSGLLLHTLYYSAELHEARKPPPPKVKFSAQEVSLAKQLVEQLSGSFKLKEFHDVYRKNVEELIARKRKGMKITSVEQPKKAKVVDLMEALRQSIKNSGAASKKPAKRSRVA